MRKTVLVGVAAAAALTLVTAAPASAEPETIVTTHSVPADTAIAIPYDYDVWSDANGFVEDGAVAFPLEAIKYDGESIHHTFAMSATAPEGCVRVIDSFTFGYTLAEYRLLEDDSMALAGGIGTGEPLEFASAGEGGVVLSGDGEVYDLGSDRDIDRNRVWVEHPIFAESQSGVLTMSYPVPVGPEEARGYISFWNPDVVTWTVDHASFLVTDTCTSEAEPPVVVPPIVEPPVVEPPVVEPPVVEPPLVEPPVVDAPIDVAPAAPVAAQPLAETGVDAGFAGAAATLLLGAGVAGLLLARRRARAS